MIELARQYSVQAIQELAFIMVNRNYKPRDRAYAAALILDRGLGSGAAGREARLVLVADQADA